MKSTSPNDRIAKFLNYYVMLPDPRYAVMLTGTWGCGKTFFIKHWKKELEDSIDNDHNSSLSKPLYVSLFGLSSISDVNDAVTKEVYPFLKSRLYKLGKVAMKAISSVTLQCDLTKLGENDLTEKATMKLDLVSLFKSGINENNKQENRIIIFDDFERCKVPYVDLLGYINQFVEHSNIRVIILCYEGEVRGEGKDDYIRFKEKIIGRTFRVEPDTSAAINSFCEQPGVIQLDDNQKYLVREAFETARYHNLRSLYQALQDFSNLKLEYDPTNQRQKKLFERFLIKFVIAYCEYFSNEKVRQFSAIDPKLANLLDYNPFDGVTNEEKKALNNKYEHLFGNTLNSPFDEQMQYILLSIVDGSDISGFINYELNPVGSMDDILFKLNDYPYLENKEFESLYSTALSYIADEKADIFTIYSIMNIMSAIETDDVRHIPKKTIATCKKNCLDIVSNTSDIAILVNNLILIEKNIPIVQSDEIHRAQRKWFIDFRQAILNSIRDRIKQLWCGKAQALLTIDNDNFEETIKSVFCLDLEGEQYVETPVFQNINPEEFAKALCFLDNNNKIRFSNILTYRYNLSSDSSDLFDIFSEEIPNLKEISNEIDILAKIGLPLDRVALKKLSSTFSEAAKRIESTNKQRKE